MSLYMPWPTGFLVAGDKACWADSADAAAAAAQGPYICEKKVTI